MKNKLRIILTTILILTSLTMIMPMVSAKSRNSYLVDFLYSNQGLIEDGEEMFGETYQDTVQALEMLNYFNAFTVEGVFGVEKKVDKVALSDYLEEKLIDMFDSKDLKLYDLYYILQSLSLVSFEIESSLSLRIHEYLNASSQNMGGFAPSNVSTSSNLISTYFAYLIYDNLGLNFPNQTIHKAWVLNCSNQDGGYGANSSLSSTLITTNYAVYIINEIDTLDALVNKSKTLEFLNAFYVSDVYDSIGYGGYLPTIQSFNPLLSSTNFASSSIDLIDSSHLHKDVTTDWILDRQNFQDGGFSDKYNEDNQELSSITATYYAFKTLLLLKSESSLNQDIFMVEFNYLILIIVLSIIGLLAILSYILWRRRKI